MRGLVEETPQSRFLHRQRVLPDDVAPFFFIVLPHLGHEGILIPFRHPTFEPRQALAAQGLRANFRHTFWPLTPYFVGEVNRAFYRRMVPSNGSLGSNLTCAILIPSAISVISVGFEQRSE